MKKNLTIVTGLLSLALLTSCAKDEYIRQTEASTITLAVTETAAPTLTVLYDNTNLFLDATKEGALSYQWIPTGETTAIIEFIPNHYLPGTWYSQEPSEYLGGYSVMVTYADTVVQYNFAAEYGESIVYCPTGFSPGSDGLNDYWIVTRSTPDITIQSVSIFSEDGKKLYHTSEGEQPNWDGRYKGTACPVGTYYFTLHFTSPSEAKMSREGVIQIIR
jgi:gliding motility-associated-like protein